MVRPAQVSRRRRRRPEAELVLQRCRSQTAMQLNADQSRDRPGPRCLSRSDGTTRDRSGQTETGPLPVGTWRVPGDHPHDDGRPKAQIECSSAVSIANRPRSGRRTRCVNLPVSGGRGPTELASRSYKPSNAARTRPPARPRRNEARSFSSAFGVVVDCSKRSRARRSRKTPIGPSPRCRQAEVDVGMLREPRSQTIDGPRGEVLGRE